MIDIDDEIASAIAEIRAVAEAREMEEQEATRKQEEQEKALTFEEIKSHLARMASQLQVMSNTLHEQRLDITKLREDVERLKVWRAVSREDD